VTLVLAIDPGNEQSAWVLYDHEAGRPLRFAKQNNESVLELVNCGIAWTTGEHGAPEPDVIAIEMIASYGMAVGREVFETCVWIGRFVESWNQSNEGAEHPALIYRKDVKLHLCGQPRAKDANIRAALIDRFGPGKGKAIGKKASPGPLYGVSSDVWSALAVAVTFADGAAKASAA
jgi:hypothetical protein